MPNATKRTTSKKRSSPRANRPRPEDYQVALAWSDEDECYVATLPAWQNVRTHGASLEEAAKNAREVLRMLITSALRDGDPIPAAQRSFSGSLRIRIPRSLHGRLARDAEREGVSLNQWIVAKLAG